MLFITNLLHFKSYASISFQPSEHINLITGQNGSGKTNLLDSIYLSCLGKNIRNLPENMLIKTGETQYMVASKFLEKAETIQVSLGYIVGEKRKIFINKEPLLRLADFVGRFPVVFFSPDDAYYLLETSEERRKLINNTLCQAYPAYLSLLSEYNHYLDQRNALLKQFAERHYQDLPLLEQYTEKLIYLGKQIFAYRKAAITQWEPLVIALYQNLSADKESIGLNYLTTFAEGESIEGQFQESLPHDLAAKRTTIGSHKDDLELLIDNLPLKKAGSQGQTKTFIIALKLVLAQWLQSVNGKPPILLLDDIFDKLDDSRIAKLITWLDAEPNQIFITDARPERSLSFFKSVTRKFAAWEVKEGEIMLLN